MSVLRGKRSGSGDRGHWARARVILPPSPSYPASVAEPGSLTCANCAGTILECDAQAVGWRFWSDGVGELHLFCPTCAYREFAPNAPASFVRAPEADVPAASPPLRLSRASAQTAACSSENDGLPSTQKRAIQRVATRSKRVSRSPCRARYSESGQSVYETRGVLVG